MESKPHIPRAHASQFASKPSHQNEVEFLQVIDLVCDTHFNGENSHVFPCFKDKKTFFCFIYALANLQNLNDNFAKYRTNDTRVIFYTFLLAHCTSIVHSVLYTIYVLRRHTVYYKIQYAFNIKRNRNTVEGTTEDFD